jgi:hypothetical protein
VIRLGRNAGGGPGDVGSPGRVRWYGQRSWTNSVATFGLNSTIGVIVDLLKLVAIGRR